jgi:hypothetical protein
MPRYFFHLAGNRVLIDDEGQIFADPNAAMAHARQVAWELAKNRMRSELHDAAICVVDAEDRKITRISLNSVEGAH